MEDGTETRHMIEEIVQKIVAEYAPQKIILFGSHAYGHPDEESDLDLLVIKDTDKRPIERWTDLKRTLRDRDRATSVSPIVYTPKELEERLASGDFFIREVLEKGEVLYG
ncbi:MAG: nucleotidyltransferase domain-containing protein [Firmicutes bacterium]|nr:nucleotidyltransferase domain-containing protein [Bacillota bacterium]